MYRKTEKIINRFLEKEYLAQSEQAKLKNLSRSKNWRIRCDVAYLMRKFYIDEFEQDLYRMTFDRHWDVRLEAVDSLCMGRSLTSLKRLQSMCENRNMYFRFYALQSHFDVYMNLNGREEASLEKYSRWLDEFVFQEKSAAVILAVHKIRYILGYEDSFHLLLKVFVETLKVQNYDLCSIALNLIDEILDEKNFEQFYMVSFPYSHLLNDENKNQIQDIYSRFKNHINYGV